MYVSYNDALGNVILVIYFKLGLIDTSSLSIGCTRIRKDKATREMDDTWAT